jgi:hypothetical protein
MVVDAHGPQGFEHAGDALGVVLVHLAAERGNAESCVVEQSVPILR